MLDMLVRWCGGDSGVMCSDLVALINWKSEPNQSVLDRVAANIGQTTSPHLKSKYRTSSQKIKAIVGEVKLLTTQSHGVPTIRSDLPAPRIKRVADHTVSSRHSITNSNYDWKSFYNYPLIKP